MDKTIKETKLRQLKALLARFREHLAEYTNSTYKEDRLRNDFLNPFFELLDWDVANRSGKSEDYRDVIIEDSLDVSGNIKAPDYCFKIGKERKFYVEAKKPSVDIKENSEPAYQIRRYGYTAGLPLCILTDFHEFAVYDTRIKPDKNDKAGVARTFYCTYEDYEKNFDFIYDTFSKNAIEKGSFDKYASDSKAKRGTESVDKGLLELIESFRIELAKNIALRNKDLDLSQLNSAVTRIIDRIIFLRIAEDREVEKYGTLLEITKKDEGLYALLKNIFVKADSKYNSELFKPEPYLNNLHLDDKILKEIILTLYYPDCPYEFSVLPLAILGSIYERFLGKTIRLTEGHQAKVEDKPEVRKAGGVYYTPQYIVNYIVENTVGVKIKGLKPAEISNLKICDPACGSGSFLIGAYNYLLDYHLDYYTADKNINKAVKGKAVYQTRKGYKLTIDEKRRILLNNIYGVDIDPQAVEVTKLSLLLKLMEGETRETAGELFAHSDIKLLPNLSDNIKCGNSLISGSTLELKKYFGEDYYKINAFDWQERFPAVMSAGGFDVVMGNPPYGYMIPENQQKYFNDVYKNQDYQKDWYLLFLERYSVFLRKNGLLGVIVSNTWLQSIRLRKIRIYLTNNYSWKKILLLPDKVFSAVVDTHVLLFKNTNEGISKTDTVSIDVRKDQQIINSHKLKGTDICKNGDFINVSSSSYNKKVYDKIVKASNQLVELCDVYNGIKPFEKGKGNPPQTNEIMKDKPYVKEGPRPSKEWKPLLRGSLIRRYTNLWNNDYWVKYGPWLAAPRDPSIFNSAEKIMIRQTGDSLISTMIGSGFIARNNMHVITSKTYDLRYILSLINSRLMDYVYSFMNPEKGEALAEVKKQHVEQLPIMKIDRNNKSDQKLYDNLISLVDVILDFNEKAKNATGSEKEQIQRQISQTDHEIDELVYKLYGLTKKEIEIVGNSGK